MKKKPVPKIVRPQLTNEVAIRLWNFCQKNNLYVGSVADEAIIQWLEQQEAQSVKQIEGLEAVA